MRKFYTPQDLARIAGVDPNTVRRWIKAGIVRGQKVGGRYRIPASEMLRFISEHEPDTLAWDGWVYEGLAQPYEADAIAAALREAGQEVIQVELPEGVAIWSRGR